ncbi:MAG: TrkA family potassium uptake protein [Candidatus Omnitrophica bacterium]|nr:TrkA family potassium uptake protein [Candidatus Omnitrophota bacterium]
MYIIIMGCGRVGSELAKLLDEENNNVVVIDRNSNSFRRLGSSFNGVTIVGNGLETDLLKEAGIEKSDAFAAVTNGDNTNIMAAQIARKMFKVPKVIARVYDPQRAQIYTGLGLDIISGTVLLSSMIRDKIVESYFSSFLIENAQLGVMEIDIGRELAGKKAIEMNLPGEFQVVTIVKKEKKDNVVIPTIDTSLSEGDKIVGVVKTASLDKVKKHLGI